MEMELTLTRGVHVKIPIDLTPVVDLEGGTEMTRWRARASIYRTDGSVARELISLSDAPSTSILDLAKKVNRVLFVEDVDLVGGRMTSSNVPEKPWDG